MHANTPILVGAGQYVCRDALQSQQLLSPVEIAATAVRRALADAQASGDLSAQVDELVVVRFGEDSVRGRDFWTNPFGRSDNVPWSVARRASLIPQRLVYSEVGGQSPQRLVNRLAERIHTGVAQLAVLTGAEAIATIRDAKRAELKLDWHETQLGEFEDHWDDKPLASDYELSHGLFLPIHIYALFEQARRHELKLSLTAYREQIARLFVDFSQCASENPYAQFPLARDAAFLSTASAENYLLCEPYTRWMVAQDAVNQGAALVLTSIGHARKLGIPESRWVYLSGYADADDRVLTERPRLASSVAQKQAIDAALLHAGTTCDALEHIDLYSCFPVAVWSACEHLGIKPSDRRRVTLTGGLPFFGGPGNNYSMHAIAEVMARIRKSRGDHGLIVANGGYLSKHSVGVYSGVLEDEWSPQTITAADHKRALPPAVAISEQAVGTGRIESVAAIYKRGEHSAGVIVGRLDADGTRFLARPAEGDHASLALLFRDEVFGAPITVEHRDKLNYFVAG